MKNEEKDKVNPYHFAQFKKDSVKMIFKTLKTSWVTCFDGTVAQDARQVTQDVFNKLKKCLKNEQKVKVNPYHFASFKKIL